MTPIGLIQLCLTWKVEYCPPALLILKLYSALKRNGYHTNSFVLKKNAAWVHNIQVLPRSQIETTCHQLFILIHIKDAPTSHAEICFHLFGKRNLFFFLLCSTDFSALSSTKEDRAWTFCIDLSVKGKKGNPYAAFSVIFKSLSCYM